MVAGQGLGGIVFICHTHVRWRTFTSSLLSFPFLIFSWMKLMFAHSWIPALSLTCGSHLCLLFISWNREASVAPLLSASACLVFSTLPHVYSSFLITSVCIQMLRMPSRQWKWQWKSGISVFSSGVRMEEKPGTTQQCVHRSVLRFNSPLFWAPDSRITFSCLLFYF